MSKACKSAKEGRKVRKMKNAKQVNLNGKAVKPNNKNLISKNGKKLKEQMTLNNNKERIAQLEMTVRKVKSAKEIGLSGKVIRRNGKHFISKKEKKFKKQITPSNDNKEGTAIVEQKPMMKKVRTSKKVKRKRVRVVIKRTSRLERKLKKLTGIIDPEAQARSTKKFAYAKRKYNVTWKSMKKHTEEEEQKKAKKQKETPPDPLDEYSGDDESDLCENKVMDAIKALLLLLPEDNKTKLFNDEGKDIYLQITSFKLPRTSPREIRVVLPHSILPNTPDVCLFTSDLEKGRRVDHTPTVEHFKELLSKKGVTCISEVITLRQLKTEYDRYEMKRALCNSFDVFLSDAKVCGHISHLLGKIFYDRKKVPVPISLGAKDLKKRVDAALHKSSYRVHGTGSVFVLKVANTLLTPQQICENIMAAALSLAENFPGGWDNVLQLMIKGAKTIPVPFYLSTMKDSLVENPAVKPLRPKAFASRTGDLPGVGKVVVQPQGDVLIVQREKLDRIERDQIKREHWLRREREEAKQSKRRSKYGMSKNTDEEAEIEFTEEDLYRSDPEDNEVDEQSITQRKRRRLEVRNESDDEDAGVGSEIKNRYIDTRVGARSINALEKAYLQDWQSSQSSEKSKTKSKKPRK